MTMAAVALAGGRAEVASKALIEPAGSVAGEDDGRGGGRGKGKGGGRGKGKGGKGKGGGGGRLKDSEEMIAALLQLSDPCEVLPEVRARYTHTHTHTRLHAHRWVQLNSGSCGIKAVRDWTTFLSKSSVKHLIASDSIFASPLLSKAVVYASRPTWSRAGRLLPNLV